MYYYQASLEAKLSQEMESTENGWFDRMAKDAAVHSIFANLVLKVRPGCRDAVARNSFNRFILMVSLFAVARDLPHAPKRSMSSH